MSTHNICLYEEVKKKYTGCNLKTMEFLGCMLIGVCVIIRLNRVSLCAEIKKKYQYFLAEKKRIALSGTMLLYVYMCESPFCVNMVKG